MDADVVDGDEIGVVERTRESRLLLEAPDQLGVPGQGLVDDLEGDVPSEPGVPRPVDLGHSPGAEGGEHLVRTQPAAGSQAHASNLTGPCATAIAGRTPSTQLARPASLKNFRAPPLLRSIAASSVRRPRRVGERWFPAGENVNSRWRSSPSHGSVAGSNLAALTWSQEVRGAGRGRRRGAGEGARRGSAWVLTAAAGKAVPGRSLGRGSLEARRALFRVRAGAAGWPGEGERPGGNSQVLEDGPGSGGTKTTATTRPVPPQRGQERTSARKLPRTFFAKIQRIPAPRNRPDATVALILVALSRKKCATDLADPRAPDRLDGPDRRLTLIPLWKEQEHEHHSALEPGA